MMKRILRTIIVSCMIFLSGCGNTNLNEDDMIAGFPEEAKVIYVDQNPIELDVENLRIEKRKNDEEFDTVYCSVIMSNENYSVDADYILYYSYYDEGGWILDNWEKTDSYTSVVGGISRDVSDAELSKYYFDEFEYIEQIDYVEDNCSDTIYYAEFESEYFSYNGNIKMQSSFISEYDGGYWVHYLYYEDAFMWHVVGEDLVTDPEEYSNGREIVALTIDAVNQEEETIEFEAAGYLKSTDGKEYSLIETDSSRTEIVMDYTGMDYLTKAHRRFIPDEEEQERLRYEAPSLSFEFVMEGAEYAVRIQPYDIYLSRGSVGYYRGETRGSLYRGYDDIDISYSDWRYVEFKLVEE